ncbi:hypothetical protein EBBID32_26770 [Sphingobium indicum BiD32]|uniref:Uncharacterized protein n=1 Tax=Sphingobium indicum BiD32 TaxID=1301087 RepID=N1MMZ5_9SPHN|nr:hypothetical protein EBBID32_26770 [Sphingobium indicum BiD32]
MIDVMLPTAVLKRFHRLLSRSERLAPLIRFAGNDLPGTIVIRQARP